MESSPSPFPLATAECPVCACGFDVSAPPYRCTRCDTPHHRECWDWTGDCAIFGCRKQEGQPVALSRAGTALASAKELALPNVAADALTFPIQFAGLSMPFWAMFCSVVYLFSPWLSFGLLVVPMLLVRGRWRFDSVDGALVRAISFAGIEISRRRTPRTAMRRLELDDSEPALQARVVLDGGETVLVDKTDTASTSDWTRLLAVARAVQAHTNLPVTTVLRLEPGTMEKRLERLKAVEERTRGTRLVCDAGRLATLPAVALTIWLSGASLTPWTAAITYGVLAAGFLGSVHVWRRRPAPVQAGTEVTVAPRTVLELDRATAEDPHTPAALLRELMHVILVLLIPILMIRVQTDPSLLGVGLIAWVTGAAANALNAARRHAGLRGVRGASLAKDDRPAELAMQETAALIATSRLAADRAELKGRIAQIETEIDHRETRRRWIIGATAVLSAIGAVTTGKEIFVLATIGQLPLLLSVRSKTGRASLSELQSERDQARSSLAALPAAEPQPRLEQS